MKELTKEQTDKIFNTITANGCREMGEDRFYQAVNEAINISRQVESPVGQMLAKEPFTLIDILETLNKATDILLHEKDYDGNDYEQMEYCLRRSQLIISDSNFSTQLLIDQKGTK